jgi:acetyl-CoA carboxylase beta subunit
MERGLIDMVVHRKQLKQTLVRLLDCLLPAVPAPVRPAATPAT